MRSLQYSLRAARLCTLCLTSHAVILSRLLQYLPHSTILEQYGAILPSVNCSRTVKLSKHYFQVGVTVVKYYLFLLSCFNLQIP